MTKDNFALAQHMRAMARQLTQMADEAEILSHPKLGQENNASDLPNGQRKPFNSKVFRFSDQRLAEESARLYAERRIRADYLPGHLLGEPCWDMLLELFVDQKTGRRSTVSSVCRASNVAYSTALRWVSMMEAHALISIVQDSIDRRVRNVTLTKSGEECMRTILAATIENVRADGLAACIRRSD